VTPVAPACLPRMSRWPGTDAAGDQIRRQGHLTVDHSVKLSRNSPFALANVIFAPPQIKGKRATALAQSAE
jgi:hypothetical protein